MKFTGERYISGLNGSIALEHEHRYRFCLDLVKDRRVLDITCGEGFGASMMAQVADHVWGVDIDRHAIDYARKTYQRENLTYLAGSCAAIPLPDASVDVVISFPTIEQYAAHDLALDEIRRVLRPGGALVISSPDQRTYSDGRDFHNDFHIKVHAQDFVALLKGRFRYVTLLGQRIAYGSLLFVKDGLGENRSFGVDSREAVPGLPSPTFNVAVASDDPKWAASARGGFLEDSIYRSEAVIERMMAGERQADALRAELARRMDELDRTEERLSALRENSTDRIRDLEACVEDLRRAYYSSTILRRLAFHRSGKPRGWLRKTLLADNKGTPRRLTRRILFKKNGRVRPAFEAWYARRDSRTDYSSFLRERIASGDLASVRTVHIVTTGHTEFVGEALATALGKTRLVVTRGTIMPTAFNHDLYIIAAPQMFSRLPPKEKLILFQLEQVRASNWVHNAYIDRLLESLAVLDYSRDNIAALTERGVPGKQVYYVPIRPLRRAAPPNPDRDIDVLFYGAIASERRQRYLAALGKKVNLRVESDTFGPALRDVLDRSKIVVNIHYYENALLETTRLGEALSHGAFVVSEHAVDQIDHLDSYRGMVDFVPRNDVDAFVARVEDVLAAWRTPITTPMDDGFDGTTYHILRALNGIGVLTYEELCDACADMKLPSGRLILALPEQKVRYDFARRNALPGAVLFHGLRQADGWRGCALSYKFMAQKAITGGLSSLLVYEDDAAFAPGTNARLIAIESHLSGRDSWDIFSGLLSNLHPEARITAIQCEAGEEFLELDSVIGMVFGIYNLTGLNLLANFEFKGNDTVLHTIDRYLENLKPRTLTVWPPLVGHEENLDSTLWPVKNSAAAQMIDSSISNLGDKRLAFLSNLAVSGSAAEAYPGESALLTTVEA